MQDLQQREVYKKFSKGHWLSDKSHVEALMMMTTYYRKNLNRFASEYLGLKLHLYQAIWLYLMGISSVFVCIASRAASKSYVIAIYSVCMAILYPGSMVVITSGTKGQSKLIITKKVQNELMKDSPNLCREILKIKDNQNEVEVKFRNGSTITTVTCSDNGLGNRSTININEEAKTCDKKILDKVISPFKIIRQIPFMKLQPYEGDDRFKEEPKEIYISSSIEEQHWLYKTALNARDGMYKDNGSMFIAFDLAVTLKHGIRTRKQLIEEKLKLDPVSWLVEYENGVLRSNENAYFTYEMIKENQVLKRAFYPRKNEDVSTRVSNKYGIKKQDGEIRVVSCDIAAIDRDGNDNSVFTCLRLFQESIEFNGKVQKEFRVQIPYLEALKGFETTKQAIRIRQLFEDFEADYIVLDVRNLGISVYDTLAKVLYDDDRCVEYSPLSCMNDDVIANRIINASAKPVIYCISASAKLNSEMAVNFRSALSQHKIDLLIPKSDGINEIKKYIPEYTKTQDPDEILFYERPYLETMLLLNEMIDLQYEKLEQTGLIRIRERGKETKDRYVSAAMGIYFADILARDLLSNDEEYSYENVPSCVSTFTW